MVHAVRLLKWIQLLCLAAYLLGHLAVARMATDAQLTEAEFQAFADEIALKVNLFRDAWQADPDAEFFGGTTRDYLYWLKRELSSASDRKELGKRMSELRKLPMIDVRDFVIGDSDVDLISPRGISLDRARYGVTKIDRISPDRLNPATPIGQDEIRQGYIPIEKIRLRRSGFVAPAQFGDGVGEIYRDQVTFHPASPEEFASTYFAQQKLNHPVLLSLRYLRLVAMNYHQKHGARIPGPELLSEMDPESARKARDVIREASAPGTLVPYIAQAKFSQWLNNVIARAYRSHTNPTAADHLYREFGAYDLLAQYSGLHQTNQYLFAKTRDLRAIDRTIRELGEDPAQLFRSPLAEFPDGYLYHGTQVEQAFRAILLQGTLPSESGSAGKGLYGVSHSNIQFAVAWGGSADRVVKLVVKPEARILDIRQGRGLALRARFSNLDEEAFCEKFGVDILKYPYGTEAFVVKNSGALGKAEGHRRTVETFAKLLQQARQVSNTEEGVALIRTMGLGQFNRKEIGFAMKQVANPLLRWKLRFRRRVDPLLLEQPNDPAQNWQMRHPDDFAPGRDPRMAMLTGGAISYFGLTHFLGIPQNEAAVLSMLGGTAYPLGSLLIPPAREALGLGRAGPASYWNKLSGRTKTVIGTVASTAALHCLWQAFQNLK